MFFQLVSVYTYDDVLLLLLLVPLLSAADVDDDDVDDDVDDVDVVTLGNNTPHASTKCSLNGAEVSSGVLLELLSVEAAGVSV
jgi:hypothetical protein